MLRHIKNLKTFISRELKLIEFQNEWRSRNTHNNTIAGRIFPIDKVRVGNYSYGTLNVISYGNPDEQLNIGNYCSIAGGTTFILSGEHDYKRISTFPFSKVVLGGESEAICKGPIIVEDDVWIGHGCTLISGVTIGKGAVIGAGSTIYRDIPAYAVYAGNRVIKYRFSDEIINKLSKFDLPKMDSSQIRELIDILETDVEETNIDAILLSIKTISERK